MMPCPAEALLLYSAPPFTEGEIIVDFRSRTTFPVPSPASLTNPDHVRKIQTKPDMTN
jgi:hypothetical protein